MALLLLPARAHCIVVPISGQPAKQHGETSASRDARYYLIEIYTASLLSEILAASYDLYLARFAGSHDEQCRNLEAQHSPIHHYHYYHHHQYAPPTPSIN